MKKIIGFLFLCALFVFTVYILYTLTGWAQREHYIFCERLVPGMTKEEVLTVLNEFGEINYGGSVTLIGHSYIFAGYKETQIVGRRTYFLNFQNGKYTSVSVITGFEKGKWVCEK